MGVFGVLAQLTGEQVEASGRKLEECNVFARKSRSDGSTLRSTALRWSMKRANK